LDPYQVFGVKKFEMPSIAQDVKMSDVNYSDFFEVLNKLATRQITGDAARAAVTQSISKFPEHAQEYIARIFDKDLKAGFSADTANSAWKQEIIPVFEIMLADKCDSPEEFLEKVTYPAHGDWKMDGNRSIAFVRLNQPVEYRARSGKISEHLEGIFDEDMKKMRDNVGYDFVLDGEAFASDFTETMNSKKAGNDVAKGNLRFHAFFLMPLNDWLAQSTKITMRQNRIALSKIIDEAGCKKILITNGREVKSYADMVAYCNEVIDVHGQEGLILKNWDAVYQWDRSMDWCKIKRFYDVDARIVAWYQGKPKSRLQGTCGGITVEGRDEHGREFRCNVGSGFSDEVRADIAENFDSKYKHQTAVITYQEMSKAKDAKFFSLRFPVYNHVRDDKFVEPIGE
jgi:DNA ligase-1